MRESKGRSRTPLALIANGYEWLARALESVLQPHGYAVRRVYDGRQALLDAAQLQPDAFILDANLSGIGGIELCRLLRSELRVTRSTPLLITTSSGLTRAKRLEALEAGAWDVLRLPVDPQELRLKLDVFVRAKMDADEARDEGLLDQMTGLYNVRGLLRRMTELVADARRYQRNLACLVLALDEMNGNANGSERVDQAVAGVLGDLAGAFRDTLRASDAVARIGEKDFVVIAPGTDRQGATILANRIGEAVAGLDSPAGNGEAGMEPGQPAKKLRPNLGCYVMPSAEAEGVGPADILLRATNALRELQSNPGHDPLRFFDPDLPLA